MRLTIARLLLLAPVLALLVACVCPRPPLKPLPDRTVIARGPRALYVTVVAKLDGNTPSFGDYHDSELVRPGDTLEFRCECAPGLEFKVSEPILVANKDVFWEDLLEADPEATRIRVAEASRWVARPSGPAPPGLNKFLQDFQKVIRHLPTAKLFADWSEPIFEPGDAAIGPFKVADPGQPFAAIWKFTWTIRAAGEKDEEKWEDLDPHIEWEPFHKDF